MALCSLIVLMRCQESTHSVILCGIQGHVCYAARYM